LRAQFNSSKIQMQKLTLLLCFAVTLSNSSPLHFKSPIRAGSTFGIISPAGCTPNPLEFQSKLTQQLESAGYKVKFSPVWSNCVGYLAGTDQDRANSVNQMFRDESVDIIMAARGGWGCARLLELIDYSAIQSNPKPIIGYSDLTALLNAITQKTGLFTLHGPLGLTNWDLEKGNYYWFDQVVGRGNRVVKFFQDLKMNSTTIRSGKAKGRLIGGNLSVFVAILGSDFLPKDYSDAILFFEDVNEPSYSIDRMLTHLELAGVLKQARGFIW
jgi:muramoyltetrapeptide carboxypeptidase